MSRNSGFGIVSPHDEENVGQEMVVEHVLHSLLAGGFGGLPVVHGGIGSRLLLLLLSSGVGLLSRSAAGVDQRGGGRGRSRHTWGNSDYYVIHNLFLGRLTIRISE